eukprot:m.75808 g.75808  ORF g.75808 m.75808 type:complete len:144 (+) comp35958_c0_seq1:161-592(+)
MNALVDQYGSSGFAVLGFPCNQFGYQENFKEDEILRSLEYIRPGNGYSPKFDLFEKCSVNGEKTHPVFQFLKEKLPYPSDNQLSLMSDPKFIVWSPVTRADLSWNFEKFLIGADGEPFRRYGPSFHTKDLGPDIERLMKEKLK